MKKIVTLAVAMAAFGAVATVNAQEATKVAGCDTCHALDKKKMGPSYKDIAAKFKGKADGEKAITAFLVEGKGPHGKIKGKEGEAAAIAKWILAQ